MITHPENLSKERLKTDLKNHGIRFNNNENKQYYVNLYRKRIMGTDEPRHEFSSDEEFSQRAGRKQQSPKKRKAVKFDTYLAEVQDLTDEELREELERYEKDCGPITSSTRSVYDRMLAKVKAEHVTGKAGVSQSSRHRESSEDEDEGVPPNESFVGEWSSEEEEEEDEVEDRGPPQRIPLVSAGKKVRESSLRVRPHRGSPSKPVEDPPEPVRHRSKPRRKSVSSSASSFYSFGVLLIMFVVAFFSYEHYSSHEADPSLITKGWKEVKCVWNWLKNYIVKTTPTPAPPTPTPKETPPVNPPPAPPTPTPDETPPVDPPTQQSTSTEDEAMPPTEESSTESPTEGSPPPSTESPTEGSPPPSTESPTEGSPPPSTEPPTDGAPPPSEETVTTTQEEATPTPTTQKSVPKASTKQERSTKSSSRQNTKGSRN